MKQAILVVILMLVILVLFTAPLWGPWVDSGMQP
jgi:hypothetical protein